MGWTRCGTSKSSRTTWCGHPRTLRGHCASWGEALRRWDAERGTLGSAGRITSGLHGEKRERDGRSGDRTAGLGSAATPSRPLHPLCSRTALFTRPPPLPHRSASAPPPLRSSVPPPSNKSKNEGWRARGAPPPRPQLRQRHLRGARGLRGRGGAAHRGGADARGAVGMPRGEKRSRGARLRGRGGSGEAALARLRPLSSATPFRIPFLYCSQSLHLTTRLFPSLLLPLPHSIIRSA